MISSEDNTTSRVARQATPVLPSLYIIKSDDRGGTEENKIKSTGYVVATLEAAVWCLLNTDSFRDCLIKAVNLGNDADTVGAVAGGLAGLFFGYDQIPEEWLSAIQRRDWIEEMCTLG